MQTRSCAPTRCRPSVNENQDRKSPTNDTAVKICKMVLTPEQLGLQRGRRFKPTKGEGAAPDEEPPRQADKEG